MDDEDDEMDRPLFQIPVYRLSERAFNGELEGLIAPYLEVSKQRGDVDEDRALRLAARLVGAYPWEFNDIVGWVTMQNAGAVVKSYLWWTTAKHITRRRSCDRYRYDGKLGETWISEGMHDSEIAAELRRDVVAFVADRAPRRHIDLRLFDRLAPHIQWREVLGLH
jgi:hypothetical protein